MPTLGQIAGIDVVPYGDFWNDFRWQQGQHITIIGTTGCGKTTLELDLQDERDYVIFLGTKSQDETQEELRPLGYRMARDPSQISLDLSDKWVFHPGGDPKADADAATVKARLRDYYREILMYCYHQAKWAVIIDEGRFICKFLGLRDEAELLYLQGRSQKNSVLMGTQRPAWVPLESFDAATHLFFFNDNDQGNIKRCAELAGIDRRAVQRAVPQLEATEDEGGQFLYYNTRTGKKMISKVEL